jgi:2'-5' RNA ligase
LRSEGEAVRCFLAIDLDDDVRGALLEVLREFRRTSADVRWVRDAGLHLTLAFLGSVETERLTAIRAAVAAVGARFEPLSLEVGGLGAFPNLRRPRVLWAGVRAAGIEELAESVGEALAGLGFAPESRRFHPHVTLGRVRSPRGWRELAPLLRERETRNFGACKASRIAAYRSDLRRDGAVYTKLWTVEMGGDDGGSE